MGDKVRCNAKSKSTGEQCKKFAVPGSSKCHYHGGKSPRGIASPNTKHGRYSKHLPGRLLERYQESLADTELLALREEVSIVDARISDLLTRVESGESGKNWKDVQEAWKAYKVAEKANDADLKFMAHGEIEEAIAAGVTDYTAWTEVRQAIELRRKLVESERKRLVDAQQMITAEQAMLLITAVTDAVRRHVSDRDTLAEIQADVAKLTAASV